MRRNEERVDWEFVAVIFKDAVTNEDSRDRDIFTRYRDKLQFNNVSLKKAVMEWTGKGSVSQVLALPDIKGIKFDFKLYVSVLPELPGKNQVQSTEPAEGSEKSKGKNTTSRPLKEVNSQESDTAHDEKCTCSDDSKQSNSDVDRSPRNLAAEPGGHNENRPPEGSPSRNEAGPAERHSPEPEEVFDPLQKAADFLIALIKRTAESQNWPLVNWLDVQKRYRDLVSGISDNDLYNEYHNYLDLHRRHLDCQQLFTWTGECCLEQLVVNPKFDAIGLIRDGAPPADLFVMVDTPEFPRSKIADYTESSRRMDSAEGGAFSRPESGSISMNSCSTPSNAASKLCLRLAMTS
ncbi:hypothetical protein Y032_0657g1246 [Ancylostoma ceylanicum]|uniref:Uncharacterized protein n=1 Tax=Ancylostoma ceylanicum TaxID=53326 RepID=A0A016WHX3_9BILA|nr:hypothetical protein Y032_0657g1246 [Ancylostoma ceylanicum]